MKVVYLRGKNPKILEDCGFSRQYESYYRNLQRYDGVEWLSDSKILGTIDEGMYYPEFPHPITPLFIMNVAKQLGIKIKMKQSPIIIDGKKYYDQLYYYQGAYHKAKELFKIKETEIVK